MTGAAAGTNGTRAISLPARYIGMPQGDLKSDPHHPGVLTDETGQPYVPIGDHYYAVRNDAANGTWRAVRLQDRATPGIPVRRDPEGQWRPHHEVGMRGGRPIPTRTQIASDLRATQASLHELTLRRIGQRQHIFDLRDMLRGHETFRDEARADLDAVRSERDFAQGMAGYYARQLERGDPEPSMRTGLERMTERIDIMTGGMAGLQRLVDQTATHIATLRTMITTTTAELEHTSESILRARQRIEELESISSDVE
ncbi:hypothetical protein [Paraburkholderia rhizosphaerae]|nr:hypothetical protein [Paraburkholderia rhizosphaerae]